MSGLPDPTLHHEVSCQETDSQWRAHHGLAFEVWSAIEYGTQACKRLLADIDTGKLQETQSLELCLQLCRLYSQGPHPDITAAKTWSARCRAISNRRQDRALIRRTNRALRLADNLRHLATDSDVLWLLKEIEDMCDLGRGQMLEEEKYELAMLKGRVLLKLGHYLRATTSFTEALITSGFTACYKHNVYRYSAIAYAALAQPAYLREAAASYRQYLYDQCVEDKRLRILALASHILKGQCLTALTHLLYQDQIYI